MQGQGKVLECLEVSYSVTDRLTVSNQVSVADTTEHSSEEGSLGLG